MTIGKRPLKRDYTKSFSLDSNLVQFDSKGFSKAQAEYIEELLMHVARIKHEAEMSNISTIIGLCAEILENE